MVVSVRCPTPEPAEAEQCNDNENAYKYGEPTPQIVLVDEIQHCDNDDGDSDSHGGQNAEMLDLAPA